MPLYLIASIYVFRNADMLKEGHKHVLKCRSDHLCYVGRKFGKNRKLGGENKQVNQLLRKKEPLTLTEQGRDRCPLPPSSSPEASPCRKLTRTSPNLAPTQCNRYITSAIRVSSRLKFQPNQVVAKAWIDSESNKSRFCVLHFLNFFKYIPKADLGVKGVRGPFSADVFYRAMNRLMNRKVLN